MGILYKYKLTNGTTYVGRDLANDNTRRAKDHFYNALVNAYNVGPHRYHYQERPSSFKFKKATVQDMEIVWGRLMKDKYSTFGNFAQEFWDYDVKGLKSIKEEITQDLQKKIKIKKIKILKDSKTVREWKEKENKEPTNNYQYHINDKTITQYQIQNVGKMTLSELEKKYKIKNDIKGNNIGLTSWKVKQFNEQDKFWLFPKPDDRSEQLNIIKIIQKITNTAGLNGTALGEYLLIALDMSTPEGLFHSLNREIGQYSKIYNNIIQEYKKDININDIQKNSPTKKIFDKTLKQKVNNAKINFINYFEKFLTTIHTHLIDNKDINADIKIINPLLTYLEAWFSSRSNSDEYWNKTAVTMKSMLKECFKYSLITMNLSSLIRTNKKNFKQKDIVLWDEKENKEKIQANITEY